MSTHLRTLVFMLAALLAALSAVSAGASRRPVDAAPAADPFDPASWTTACIDCVNRLEGLSNRTAALAPDGALHVVYGGEALHHLVYRGGAWSVALVEAPAQPLDWFLDPVMAIDKDGRIHVVYAKAADGVRYARQTAAGWQIETLPIAPGYLWRAALALDAAGTAHVVANAHHGLVYIRREAGGWTTPMLLDEYGGIPALALDGDGHPAACYHVATPPYDFAVARFDGAAWRFDEIPGGSFDDTGCDLAFAADGRLRLVALVDDGLRYFRRDDAGWTNEIVLSTTLLDRPGYAPSLRFDPDGRPVIAFHTVYDAEEYDYRDPLRRLQIVTRTLTGWQLETVDDRPDARDATLLFDGDAPYIVYRDRLGLALAERRGGSWQFTRLDRSGDLGFDPSLVFHGFEMRAAYYDGQNDAVFYAAGGPGRWAIEPVDQRPGQAGFSYLALRLALGPDGSPRFVYEFDDDLASFTYAFRSGPYWNHDALPGSGCGPYAIAVDRAGRSYLTQYDCPGLGLSFIPWPPPPLHNGMFEQVDAQALHNPLTIVVDSAGRFHLAYTAVNGPKTQIRYAVRETDGRWTTSPIFDQPYVTGTGVDLALDPSGRPIVVFNHEGIIVATPGAPGERWTLDEGLRAEQGDDLRPEVEVDRQGALHVVYHQPAQGALVYARHDGDGWRTITLTGSGPHSLALGPFGNPAVAYRDGASGDAMVTYIPADVRATAFLPAVSR